MVVTIRDLLDKTDLSLTCVAGTNGIDCDIRWVHVSEVVDPTPWLKGGEFLITTGFLLGDLHSMAAYVDRLADLRVAGIGFGTGPGLGTLPELVPDAMIDAANRRGIPLVEVPFSTPYVAISEFVASHIAAEQFEMVQRAYETQRRLTSAALEADGRVSVVSLLAQATGSQCAVVSLSGEVLDCAPADRIPSLQLIKDDLQRVRVHGMVSQISDPDGTTYAIHPVGTRRRTRQILVVRKEQPLDQFDQMIISGAVTLLSIDAERRLGFSAERHAAAERLGAIALRVGSLPEDREDALVSLGFTSTDPVAVAQLWLPGIQPQAVSEAVNGILIERRVANVLVGGAQPGTQSLIGQTSADVLAEAADAVLAELDAPGLHAGVGNASSISQIPVANHQAEIALRYARDRGDAVAQYAALPLYGVVLASIPSEQLAGLTDSIFGPLDRLPHAERQAMLDDLRAFLRHNGRAASAATERGVHRQTFLKRIARISDELACDLNSSDDRSALWLGLLASDFPAVAGTGAATRA